MSFQAQDQYYKHPDMLVLKDVSASLRYQNDIFNLEADEIILHDIIQFAKKRERARITTKGLDISVRDMACRSLDLNANIIFKKKRVVKVHGIFRNMVFQSKPYDFYDISGKIEADNDIFEIVELSGYWETGLWRGQLKFERNLLREYAVFLSFSNFNPGDVKNADYVYFHMDGLMDGTLRMSGSINTLDMFVLDLTMKYGGHVEPSLLKLFSTVSSDKSVKGLFLSLSEQGQSFEFDTAAFLIHDFQDYRGQVMMNLVSQRANINWMERIPIKNKINWLEFIGF